jgi:hypothetical protein
MTLRNSQKQKSIISDEFDNYFTSRHEEVSESESRRRYAEVRLGSQNEMISRLVNRSNFRKS